MKSILIDTRLFFDLCDYFTNKENVTDEEKRLEAALLEKLDRVAARIHYSESKTNPDPAERRRHLAEYRKLMEEFFK